MVPEARLEPTEHGLVPRGDGWFVLNAREACWRPGEGRGAGSRFEGDPELSQLGIQLVSLAPGEPMAMYHWEAEQETTDPEEAYKRFPKRETARYREGWLPED